MVKIKNPPFRYIKNNLIEELLWDGNKIYREPKTLQFVKGLYLINIPNITLLNVSMFSDTYYFKINSDLFVEGINLPLKKGEYIFKIMKNYILKSKSLNILAKASKLNLLPKIIVLTPYFIIMEFIESVNLLNIKLTPALSKYLFINISNELKKWHENRLYHGDLALRNILLDKKGKVWIIDPYTDLLDNLINDDEYEEIYHKDISDLKDIKNELGLNK